MDVANFGTSIAGNNPASPVLWVLAVLMVAIVIVALSRDSWWAIMMRISLMGMAFGFPYVLTLDLGDGYAMLAGFAGVIIYLVAEPRTLPFG